MTTVEVERSGVFESIPYGDFRIETGTSNVRLAPEATVTTSNNVTIEPNQRLRISIDGTVRFEGTTISSGKQRGDGRRRVQAEHDAYRIFDEFVSVEADDAEAVLLDAIASSNFGSFTLTYTGTSEAIDGGYARDNRKVKQIFRDIADRTNRIFWVDAASNSITVEPTGARGEFTAVSLPGDDAAVREYEEGSVRSVLNDVTVVGTGEKRVEGSAVDNASIDQYGRRSDRFDISYVTTVPEAESAAEQLLEPEPLDSATVLIGPSVAANTEQTLANYELRVTAPSVGLSNDTFVIQSQKIQQGRVELDVGEAATSGIDSVNRNQKSQEDGPDVGTVIDDEIAPAAVNTPELVDLSITETKVGENSISTPKLQAEAVTANEILANTITANEIDVLDLDTQQLSIGSGLDGFIDFLDLDVVGQDRTIAVMVPSESGTAAIGLAGGSEFGTGAFIELNVGPYEVASELSSLNSEVSSLDSRVSSLESSSSSE